MSAFYILPAEFSAVPSAIRQAHQCLHSPEFQTIKGTSEFAKQALIGRDDRDSVAGTMLVALINCDAKAPSQANLSALNMWQWKDRWNNQPELFRDGYVSAVADPIRHLDDAGKTDAVLSIDVTVATMCTGTLKIRQFRDYFKFVNHALDARYNKNPDPLHSTAGAIFEILRACKVK